MKPGRNNGRAETMTKRDEIDLARAAMAKVPALAGHDGRIERLGGLTNMVFRAGDMVVRLPGEGTEAYIDRANESVAARAAAAAGVSPGVVHDDPGSGLMVTRFVPAALTMTPDLFRTSPGAPERAGTAFARLHSSGATFPFRFELFAMIDSYLGLLEGKAVDLPEGYHDVLAEAGAVRDALQTNPVPLVPCHCDPLCENFLDTGGRMWIVDWEYSGMNDPMWDLGDLSVEGEFDADQDMAMLRAYFGGPPTPFDHGRMVIYKAMCDLLWTLWGLIQLANGNPADDFEAYATRRFVRCRTLMGQSHFKRHLSAVGAG